MDPKQIIFGVAVVAASVGGSVIVGGDKSEKQQVVSATLGETDVLAATIANAGADVLAEKSCERKWGLVSSAKGPEIGWVCDGAWMPAQDQAALNKQLPADAVRATFRPREQDGKLVMDADVFTGELPLKPIEAPVEVKPAPVEEVEKP